MGLSAVRADERSTNAVVTGDQVRVVIGAPDTLTATSAARAVPKYVNVTSSSLGSESGSKVSEVRGVASRAFSRAELQAAVVAIEPRAFVGVLTHRRSGADAELARSTIEQSLRDDAEALSDFAEGAAESAASGWNAIVRALEIATHPATLVTVGFVAVALVTRPAWVPAVRKAMS